MKTVMTVLALSFFLCACGDDGDDNSDQPDSGTPFVCDPIGAAPEMGALLNEPVASDVEVIVKQPQHPGNPGPTQLP